MCTYFLVFISLLFKKEKNESKAPAGIQPLPNFNYHKHIIEEQI